MKIRTGLPAWTIIALVFTTLPSLGQSAYEPYTFSTLAGNASYGIANGTGSAARFNSPTGVAVDSAGSVYVTDTGNKTIRKVTAAGVVTTLAGLAGSFGSADGTGRRQRQSCIMVRCNAPNGVAVDSAHNI